MAVPPELMDDATIEILLRLPPDDPACLVRASLVCKNWRGILSDPAFPRRYRAFHGAPPLLSFLQNLWANELGENTPLHPPPSTALHPCSASSKTSGPTSSEKTPRFIPVAVGSPLLQPAFECRGGRAIDCRHGRVLLDMLGGARGALAVWNPIAGDRKVVHEPAMPYFHNVMVLCAAPGCKHCYCNGGPFLVVFVGSGDMEADAWVYSSETGAWSTSASVHIHEHLFVEKKRGAIVGDEIYFLLNMGTAILKYNWGNHCLSVIESPEVYMKPVVLMAMEDGSLGLADVKGSSLHLWLKPNGGAGWVKCRVIDLEKALPIDKPNKRINVIDFAEGLGILVGTDVSAFTFDLNSGRVTKIISKPTFYYDVLPFMCVYTPDFASSKLPSSAKTNKSLKHGCIWPVPKSIN